MRILLCHNYYQQAGGEDSCFAEEGTLLERHGHDVFRYIRDNDHIQGFKSLVAAGQTLWNARTYREIRKQIRQDRIELVHCTNTFPIISPSIYYACNREKVPVVQSLHNYRLMCANAYFLRDGKVCESCLGRSFAWPAVQHACYRESRLASLAVATMQAVHHRLGSWRDRVDHFIALTNFARDKFVQAGLPAERITVKPNFVDPRPAAGRGGGGYALFVGRLSSEKGIEVLLQAWEQAACSLPLRIVGGGPLQTMVEQAAEQNPRIQYLGFQPPDEVYRQMQTAEFLVVPSIWYEGLPRTIVEAYAVGTPVVASDLGPMVDLVREGCGGWRFAASDAGALVDVVARLVQQPALAAAERGMALGEFESRFSADANYQQLIEIYGLAAETCRQR